MQINVKDLLQKCGLDEILYPGKRAVKRLPQAGTHKSHCAVFDWRSPDLLRIEIKAGLSSRDMDAKELKKYPVSFQSPTYVEIATYTEDGETGEGEGEGGKGKSGGGNGKSPKKHKNSKSLHAFSRVVEGKIPDLGEVKRLVVMGKDIAKEAFESVLGMLTAQIKNLSVTPVNIIAAAHAVNVSVAEPSGGLRPKGHETTAYRYKGADMFGLENPGVK